MSSNPVATAEMELRPLPYHEAIRDYLKAEQPQVWQWFASHKLREDVTDAVRLDLLKSTYRLEQESHADVDAVAEGVCERLGLQVPVTLYQAQNPAGLNASLASIPAEAHIILHGPVTSRLTEAEFRGLLAHELSHLLLWQCCEGELLLVDQILAALSCDAQADTPHFASARLFRLYSEVFCDRGALAVVGDPHVVVSMLLKVHTDVEQVSAESYLRQAEEIFGRGPVRTEELTHPEAFIRARAVKLWAEGEPAAESKIREMIEGPPALDNLDLLAQQKVSDWTRGLLDVLLAPPWMRSEQVLAHARLFFDDYAPADSPPSVAWLASQLKTDDPGIQDYCCYVLLDFATVDRDLEEFPLAAALRVSEELGLKKRFLEIAQRELRLRKKQLEKIDEEKDALLARARQSDQAP